MYLTENDIEGLQAVLKKINADLARHHTIATLSSEAGMSTSKFKIYFKFYTGNPVFVFQKTQRLNLAYDLVCGSRYTLNKIARLCGFAFLSHFNEAFSRRFLISPFRLRKLLGSSHK